MLRKPLHLSVESMLWYIELISTVIDADLSLKPHTIMTGNTQSINNYGRIIFCWLQPSPLLCAAGKFYQQIFASTSVLLQTFNCSSAVAWVHSWLHHSEIMRCQCQACGQLLQSRVTQWQESQSRIGYFNPGWQHASETCFTVRIMLWLQFVIITVKHNIQINAYIHTHTYTYKCWKWLIYWFEMVRALDLEQQNFPGSRVSTSPTTICSQPGWGHCWIRINEKFAFMGASEQWLMRIIGF